MTKESQLAKEYCIKLWTIIAKQGIPRNAAIAQIISWPYGDRACPACHVAEKRQDRKHEDVPMCLFCPCKKLDCNCNYSNDTIYNKYRRAITKPDFRRAGKQILNFIIANWEK